MKPTIETDRYTLYLGDCREILPTLEAGSVDAVVTDPPFGIGFKYQSHNDTTDGYGEWMWSCVEMAEKLCSSGSPIFVWQAMLNVRRFAEWFPRDWRLFAAARNFVQIRHTAMQYSYDPVLVWWTDGDVWTMGTANRDFHIGDTTPQSRGEDGYVKGHPCPRPLGQVAHIVQQWARPNSTILDPFMGSGTTGVAAMKMGRKFIGIEIEPKYFEIAARRIEEAANHLFAGVKE